MLHKHLNQDLRGLQEGMQTLMGMPSHCIKFGAGRHAMMGHRMPIHPNPNFPCLHDSTLQALRLKSRPNTCSSSARQRAPSSALRVRAGPGCGHVACAVLSSSASLPGRLQDVQLPSHTPSHCLDGECGTLLVGRAGLKPLAPPGLPLCVQASQASFGPTPDRLTLALDDGSMRIASIHKLDRDVHRLQAHMGYTNVFAYSHNYK